MGVRPGFGRVSSYSTGPPLKHDCPRNSLPRGPLQGTTFILRFRVAASAPLPLATPELPMSSPRRILVIDDDDGVRTTVVALLQAAGHAVSEANGRTRSASRPMQTRPVPVRTRLPRRPLALREARATRSRSGRSSPSCRAADSPSPVVPGLKPLVLSACQEDSGPLLTDAQIGRTAEVCDNLAADPSPLDLPPPVCKYPPRVSLLSRH